MTGEKKTKFYFALVLLYAIYKKLSTKYKEKIMKFICIRDKNNVTHVYYLTFYTSKFKKLLLKIPALFI